MNAMQPLEWSITLSIILAVTFCVIQFCYFFDNMRKRRAVVGFFSRSEDYDVYGSDEDTQLSDDVAQEGSHLYSLIHELNEYIRKNHGTTDFSVIQNKTERKIDMLYEDAVAKAAFPTYIGLMGTFVGVFLGLLMFNVGLDSSGDISDQSINSLIYGVLVSMFTSFIGLLLTTITNHRAASAQKIVNQGKNEFFEFIQNELMPTLGVSMVAALNKLHHTINLFEPSFNRVIDSFQATFEECTKRFGHAFEQNVTVVSEAVCVMGRNMDKINMNVDLNEKLIRTLQSRELRRTLSEFINAAGSYQLLIDRTYKFEEMAAQLEERIKELVNTQASYNSSLQVPLDIASKLNQILARVTTFEQSIEGLGHSIKNTDLIANAEIEALKSAITAIKQKQALAVEAMEISDGHLKSIFELQAEAIKKLGRTYETSLAGYAEEFKNSLEGMEKLIAERRSEVVAAIEEKFSLDQIQHEFSRLGKLDDIERLLAALDSKISPEAVDRSLSDTNGEIRQIRKLLVEAIDEAKKRQADSQSVDQQPYVQQSATGSFFGSLLGRRGR